jgi:hypothetical protein
VISQSNTVEWVGLQLLNKGPHVSYTKVDDATLLYAGAQHTLPYDAIVDVVGVLNNNNIYVQDSHKNVVYVVASHEFDPVYRRIVWPPCPPNSDTRELVEKHLTQLYEAVKQSAIAQAFYEVHFNMHDFPVNTAIFEEAKAMAAVFKDLAVESGMNTNVLSIGTIPGYYNGVLIRRGTGLPGVKLAKIGQLKRIVQYALGKDAHLIHPQDIKRLETWRVPKWQT